MPPGHRVHDVWADASPTARSGSRRRAAAIWASSIRKRQDRLRAARTRLGAAWRDRRRRRRAVAHRRRPERHRARRSEDRAVKVWPLPEGTGYANLNTAIFDGKGVHWFTGQSGIYGRLDPEERRDESVRRAERPRTLRHPRHARRHRLLRLARRVLYRANRFHYGTVKVIEPPTRARRAPRVVRFQGPHLGGGMELGQPEPLRAEDGKWSKWQAPGDQPHVYAVYVDETDKVWAAEWSAQVMLRFDPATENSRPSSPRARVRTCARSTAARARCGRPSRAPTRSWCTATSNASGASERKSCRADSRRRAAGRARGPRWRG